MNDLNVEPARARAETPTQPTKPSDVSGRAEPQRSFRSHLERKDHDERGGKDQGGRDGDRPTGGARELASDGASASAPSNSPGLSPFLLAPRGGDTVPTPCTQEPLGGPPSTSQATVNVDVALNQVAREVSLATDGRDAYMLRFEVAQGELEGTRIAVTSHGGVISAVVVPSTPESTLRLEHALDAARLSLEERGIDVSSMEVRTGAEDRGQGRPDHHDEPDWAVRSEAPGLGPGPGPTASSARSARRGIDYFV